MQNNSSKLVMRETPSLSILLVATSSLLNFESLYLSKTDVILIKPHNKSVLLYNIPYGGILYKS